MKTLSRKYSKETLRLLEGKRRSSFFSKELPQSTQRKYLDYLRFVFFFLVVVVVEDLKEEPTETS